LSSKIQFITIRDIIIIIILNYYYYIIITLYYYIKYYYYIKNIFHKIKKIFSIFCHNMRHGG